MAKGMQVVGRHRVADGRGRVRGPQGGASGGPAAAAGRAQRRL